MTEQNQQNEINEVSLANWADTIKAEAKKMQAEAEQIVVTDANDKATIKQAREKRLAVKAMRVSVENRRKELKDYFLRTGKMIDSVASEIKALLEPIESHLEAQEKFAEIQAKKEREQRIEIRKPLIEALGFAMQDFCIDMPEQDFELYLDGLKKQKAEKEEAERLAKEAEEKRIEAERAERERIKAENELLKKQAEEAERVRLAEQKEREQKERERLEAERKAQDELRKAEEARLKAEREAQLAKERAERERMEAERLESERKALKIEGETFADEIPAFNRLIEHFRQIEIPSCKSEKGKKLGADVDALRQKIIAFIEQKI